LLAFASNESDVGQGDVDLRDRSPWQYIFPHGRPIFCKDTHFGRQSVKEVRNDGFLGAATDITVAPTYHVRRCEKASTRHRTILDEVMFNNRVRQLY
jgi:hypothetical protein